MKQSKDNSQRGSIKKIRRQLWCRREADKVVRRRTRKINNETAKI
jgi:hypothetical protein